VTPEGLYSRPKGSVREELAYRVRIIRVFARTEFKLKYAESILGYFWSLAKPLIYFATLWVVFSRLFKTSIPEFGLYLIVGVVFFTYLSDSVSTALPSIVARGSVLRRISFPSLSVPLGSLTSSTMTFGLNLVAVVVFVAVADVTPSLDWLLIIPLLLELVVFVVGVALIASSLYVRLRDIGQIWEVLAMVILYTSAIMYPITILPEWAQRIVGLNPLVQITQDVRRLLLSDEPDALAVIPVLHSQVFPVLIALSLLVVGVVLHRREAPRFPELA
jgi:ABC-2 type transport system permease protein